MMRSKSEEKKQKKIEIAYKQAEGISEEEMQRRLNTAFDILFDEVVKSKK